MSESEIIVSGAGFIGLSFALAAQARGFDVAVYDKKSKPAPVDVSGSSEPSARVIALNPASVGFLTDLHVFERIDPRHAAPYHAMEVFDGEGAGNIRFDADEAGLLCLGHIVDQQALLYALSQVAIDQSLPVHWDSEPDLSIAPPLLVGADGAQSSTRERLGLRKIQYAYDQRATVCVIRTSQSHGATARQWFQESGPLAALPLADSHTLALVWSDFSDLAGLSDHDFVERLMVASEGALGTVISVGQRFSFGLQQMQALQYVAPGVVLIGDAAHAIHPLAGQGANLGFADVAALTRELANARLEGAQTGDLKTLRRYERARRSENHIAAAAMEGFHRLFTSKLGVSKLLRSQGMRFVQGNTTIRQLAISVASGRV